MADIILPFPKAPGPQLGRAERELQSCSGKASPFSGSLRGSSVTKYGLEWKGDEGETSGRERREEQREKING